jgi:hypothetical protein
VLGGVKPDGTTITNSTGAISVTYGSTSNTAAQGNDSRIVGAVQLNGVLGTPFSGTITNLTGTAAGATVGNATAAASLSAGATAAGSSSQEAIKITNGAEAVDIIAAAPSATQNFYAASGAIQYYTTNAANNWTINWAWSSGTSMNTAMATGDAVTVVMETTQGSTAYYANAFTVDGSSVTPKWMGGAAPTAGDASSIDVYTCTIQKTASATYNILCALTQYK